MTDDGRLEDAASKIEQKNLLTVHTLKRGRDQIIYCYLYIYFSKQAGRFLSQPQEWAKDVHENFHLC